MNKLTIVLCACGCGNPVKPGLLYLNRTHSNRRKDKPRQGGHKYPKKCGKGRAGIAI